MAISTRSSAGERLATIDVSAGRSVHHWPLQRDPESGRASKLPKHLHNWQRPAVPSLLIQSETTGGPLVRWYCGGATLDQHAARPALARWPADHPREETMKPMSVAVAAIALSIAVCPGAISAAEQQLNPKCLSEIILSHVNRL
jgi:hypothetical protein